MIKEYINKEVEAVIAFSQESMYGSLPKTYKGLLLDIDDNFLKIKKIDRKGRTDIIVIAIKFLISLKRI